MLDLHFETQLPDFRLAVNCNLPGQGFTAILGPSGCGKTTLASNIAGLKTPSSGRIAINGLTFWSSDKHISLPVNRRGIGFVFQTHRLFPHLTVFENLHFANQIAGRPCQANANELIDVLGIGHLLKRYPDTLSGGESQRVALGRAILAAETLLIMDEPLASLDSERKEELLGYFEQIPKISSLPILYITHSANEAKRLANTILTMSAGTITHINHQKGCSSCA